MNREAYMRMAIAEAERAQQAGDVPVGAVVVCGGEVIAQAGNEREQTGDPTAHAEMLALRRAAKRLGRRRLDGCTLYVTLEPCPMCAGAIINARVPEVFYGAREAQSGACGSVIDLFFERFGHQPTVSAGLCGEACAGLLKDFFEEKRKGPLSKKGAVGEAD